GVLRCACAWRGEGLCCSAVRRHHGGCWEEHRRRRGGPRRGSEPWGRILGGWRCGDCCGRCNDRRRSYDSWIAGGGAEQSMAAVAVRSAAGADWVDLADCVGGAAEPVSVSGLSAGAEVLRQ